MSQESDRRLVEGLAQAVGDELLVAVSRTVEDPTPDSARSCTRELLESDRRSAPDGRGGAVELTATLALVRWLSLAREELADRPERVDEVLTWIEDALGKRYRARARYTSGALQSEDGASEVMEYRKALQEDFLPSLVWLVAGAVARYGDGDTDWLRRLERPAAGA
jgi:hypothetical protein